MASHFCQVIEYFLWEKRVKVAV